MGQISNILDGRILPGSVSSRPISRRAQASNLARLIPGMENSFRQKPGPNRRRWFEGDDFALCAASLFTSLLFTVVLYHLHVDILRLPLFLTFLISCFIAVLGRKTLRGLGMKASARRNVLLVGNPTLAKETFAEIRSSFGSRPSMTRAVSGAQFEDLCAGGKFANFAREQFLDEILIVSRDVDLSAVVNEARRQRLDVTFAVPLLGDGSGAKITVEHAGRAALIGVHRERVPVLQLSAKRVADALLSALALIALLPLMLVIAIIVAVDSEGPVFYRSQRVGLKGRKFPCYKFRTMVANADAGKEQLRKSNERTGAFFKMSGDPRITRVGKFLRRYSLDELPQLWNVFRGDMSLVGPRPHPPDDLERYRAQHLRRLDFVPGMTGLWQVTARQDPSFERSVALDVEYIRNWNLWLDLQILCRTVGAVVRGSGV